MRDPRERLPVDDALPELRAHLAAGTRVVLHAPPGAGKTTRVPLALLPEPWLDGRRIVMLEPRRLAARAAATHMARLLGERVGDTVGYRIRMDTRVGPRTRIEVVTEGVLTRMLQHDPALDDVGLLIFDEFHERSVHADLGLALALQAQSLLRADLRIIVMSATLEDRRVAELLDDAPVVQSQGLAHPVDTVYLDRRVDGFIEAAVAATVERAVRHHDGDVLVFLPGAAEIRRTAQRLDAAALPPGTTVMPLYGDLPQDAQDRAIAPSPPRARKIVLATSIAETSLTIEGVRIVVDSGLVRVPRFSPRTGMTRLATAAVSRAGADQRRGRAGRLAPGVCYRMWTEGDHAALLAHRPPEIADADLGPLVLELAAWGVRDPAELRWLDPPPAAAVAQASELLRELDAIDEHGRITAHGRAMAELAPHPRLAHMLIRAAALGLTDLAADIAALIGERDFLRAHDGTADPDLRLRLPLLRGPGSPPLGHQVDAAALQRVRAEARHWRQRSRGSGTTPARTHNDDDGVGVVVALAYPDRVGQQRGARGRFVLRNGRAAGIEPQHSLATADFIAAADVGGAGRDSRIFLAAPIERADVERLFADRIETTAQVAWDAGKRAVTATESRRIGAIVLAQRPLGDVPDDLVVRALLDGIRAEGLQLLDWTRDAVALRARLAFLHTLQPADWPDVSDAALLDQLEQWLLPWCTGIRSADGLRRVDVQQALLARIDWARRATLDSLAPTHVDVPSGSRVAIDYSDAAAPVLAVRLQEMFGLQDTPRIAGGRVALTLHLLSPARRPVQVTRDLASFWKHAYFEVRRDLRGRYPRHFWPEDPLQAEPTRRIRPRR